MKLTHYIIIRRDLPLGTLAAMVVHAAGESASFYQDPYDGRFQGATAVVLEVKDEAGLVKAEGLLFEADVPHVVVTEKGGPYDGQTMAIGVVPSTEDRISRLLEKFQTLKTCLDNGNPSV